VQSSGDQAAMGGMSDCPMMKMASDAGDDADEVGHSAHH